MDIQVSDKPLLGLSLHVTSTTHGNVEPSEYCLFTKFEEQLVASADRLRIGE